MKRRDFLRTLLSSAATVHMGGIEQVTGQLVAEEGLSKIEKEAGKTMLRLLKVIPMRGVDLFEYLKLEISGELAGVKTKNMTEALVGMKNFLATSGSEGQELLKGAFIMMEEQTPALITDVCSHADNPSIHTLLTDISKRLDWDIFTAAKKGEAEFLAHKERIEKLNEQTKAEAPDIRKRDNRWQRSKYTGAWGARKNRFSCTFFFS